MKRSKNQDPRSREDPSSKIQSDDAPSGFSPSWDQSFTEGAMMLKDGPLKVPERPHAFDLLERTAVFGEGIVRLSKKIPRNPTNDRLIDQLVGCGTSVGANYC